jgi:hypothetical protein
VKRAFAILAAWWLVAAAPPALGQIAMPDAREMSGIPRPVTDLPDRTVSIRLIRGSLSNNIANHPVELHVDGQPETRRTSEDGRVEFGPLRPGARLKAVAVVDGERLESQEFPSPQQGGIRLMLVATDKEPEAQAARERAAPPVAGEVVLGGDTRFVIENGDENVRVFYMLDIVNTARTPVEPPAPFLFDAPTGAQGVTVMEGSSPSASVTGTRVRVQGPFAPGTTSVQIGYLVPTPRGSVAIEQRFPAPLERLGLLVEKVGDAALSSPQLERQQEMPIAGRTYIAGAGGALPAGEPLVISVTGLPHHSLAPRYVALALVAAIVLGGAWVAWRPVPPIDASERKRLVARRERLLQDLVKLESARRRGRVDEARYASRRGELVDALEQVYGALEPDDAGPEPAGRAGLAA